MPAKVKVCETDEIPADIVRDALNCAIEHFYRDVRLFRIYESTTKMQQVVIACNLVSEASR